MTHDPLCHWHGKPYDSWKSCQECDLIAKTRADTFAKCVEAIHMYFIWGTKTPEDYGFNSGIAQAVKSIRSIRNFPLQAMKRDDLFAGYEQGERDMLAQCIAAVSPIVVDPGGLPQAEKVMEALRALGEQQ